MIDPRSQALKRLATEFSLPLGPERELSLVTGRVTGPAGSLLRFTDGPLRLLIALVRAGGAGRTLSELQTATGTEVHSRDV